ncbi:MAG: DUF4115 domain-containing protein [Spirochaetes bacterium]|nr:DUF4115 domain-containing protein [Spirochaetota bacterium]
MESIGDRLKAIRESKKMTIKEVAKETNIAHNYIEALENEEFERFPGETYVVGFIRSYSEYLKIDPEEIVQAYKGYKIGESITPLEELTRPTRSSFDFSRVFGKSRPVLLAAAGIAAAGLVIWGITTIFSGRNIDVNGDNSIENIKSDYNNENKKEFSKIINAKMNGDKANELLYVDEALQFLSDTKECLFVLRTLNDTSAVIEVLPGNEKISLAENVTSVVVFPGSKREIKITLTAKTENRARFQVELGASSETAGVVEDKQETQNSTQVVAQNKENLKIVFEAEFVAKTYIEIYLDGQQKERGIIQAGTFEKWEANEFIQMKIGNAGGVNAKINGKEYKFGLQGQIANKVISWKKDPANPNIYNIVVKDW